MRAVAAALLSTLLAGSASAQAVSPRPDSVRVTIYQADDPASGARALYGGSDDWTGSQLAMVIETRTVDVPPGAETVRFEGVADGIVPQTIRMEGLPGVTAEQNFDYDLLSPGSLLARSVDQTVRLVTADPKTGRESEQSAVVRSAPNGVVLQTPQGFQAIQCGGPRERLVFDRMPEGLTPQPTLSLRVHDLRPGRYAVRLAYLANGLGWSADYTARIASDGQTLDLSGWITLANRTDTSFEGVPAEVVAGRLSRVSGADAAPRPQHVWRSDQCWPTEVEWGTPTALPPPPPPPPPPSPSPLTVVDNEEVKVTGSRTPAQGLFAARDIQAQELADYKLYPLREPTTIASHQIKQVQFVDRRGVKFDRVYGYWMRLQFEGTIEDGAASVPTVMLRTKNTEADGLGYPLPGGSLSVREEASAAPVLIGQTDLRDTPKGEDIDLILGEARDVAVTARIVKTRLVGKGAHRRRVVAVEVTARNDKSAPITFECFQEAPYDGFRLMASDRPHKIDRGANAWVLQLKPGEMRTLHYSAEWTDES